MINDTRTAKGCVITVILTVMALLWAYTASAQTWTNVGPSGPHEAIFQKSSPPPRPFPPVPQSIIDAAAEAAFVVDASHWPKFPSFYISTYDSRWPFTNAVLLPPEPARRQPQYFGSFIPLTPDGPMINSAFLPYYPPYASQPPSVSVPNPYPLRPLPSQPVRRYD